MRLQYLLGAILLCNVVSGATVHVAHRALNDVLDGFDTALPLQTHAEHSAERPSLPTREARPNYPTFPLMPGAPTASQSGAKSKDGNSIQTHQPTLTMSANAEPAGYSVIGTIPPLPSITPWSATQPSSSLSQSPITTPTATNTKQSSSKQADSRGMQEWKIVGVAVIAFTTVAAILLLSVFFDHWWGFLKDLFGRRRHKDSFEELIPDWEKASWEIRLGSDSHRYPTLPPGAVTKQDDRTFEKARMLSTDNVAGVGSGFKNEYRNETAPVHEATSPWTQGLGILTPIPPAAQHDRQRPPGIPADGSQRQNSNRLDTHKTSISPALTDPYCGMVE